MHPPRRDPDPSAFPRVTPEARYPRARADELAITWIGHSATLIQIGGLNLLTDPMFGPRASPVRFAGPRRWVPPGVALAELPPVDLVLLTHNHYDHLDKGSVRALAARHPQAPWIVPLKLGPFGAYDPAWIMQPLHMNPEEAVQAYRDISGAGGTGVMMAVHWGTFKLTDEPMDEPPARVRAVWVGAGLPPERLWVPRHGETRVTGGSCGLTL